MVKNAIQKINESLMGNFIFSVDVWRGLWIHQCHLLLTSFNSYSSARTISKYALNMYNKMFRWYTASSLTTWSHSLSALGIYMYSIYIFLYFVIYFTFAMHLSHLHFSAVSWTNISSFSTPSTMGHCSLTSMTFITLALQQ